jgi:GAF domain-containing protein
MITAVRDYADILQKTKAVVDGEPDLVANLSNIAAILKTLDGFFWVGFYLVKGDELVLGPFQGPVACTRIARGRGVCGTSWAENRSILVPDVHAFPGHIACSAFSLSEVVVPVRDDTGNVRMVIDVDSDRLNAFDESDVQALESIAKIVSTL